MDQVAARSISLASFIFSVLVYPTVGISQTFDLSDVCSINQANETHLDSKSRTGTQILGVGVGMSVCASVKALVERGYRCYAQIGLDGTGSTYSDPSEFSFAIFLSGPRCESEQGKVDFLLNGWQSKPLSFDDVTITYGKNDGVGIPIIRTPKEEFVVDFWELSFNSFIASKVNLLSFDCGSLSSCNVTGNTLAQYLVDNVEGIDNLTVNIQLDVVGFSSLGEIITISPGSALAPKLVIERGTFDTASSGGISLE